MLGHRALNVEDYLAILKRRWWLIVIPAVVFAVAAYSVSYFIQPRYKSTTLVLIEQQQVPTDYVRPVVTEDLSNRLATMRQQIESRSSLQPIVEKYNLYANQKLSMDARLDIARASIGIDPIHSDIAQSHGLPGFYISFEANDPHTAQLVCGEIRSLFVTQSLLSHEDSVRETTDYLRSELADAKHTLDDQDARLAAFERGNAGKLPSDDSNNINILDTLNTRLEATTQTLTNMEQTKSYEEAMLAQESQSTPASASATQTPQVQQLELDDLLRQETDLKTHYTADNPDVKTVERKIGELRKEMDKPAPAPVVAAAGPSHGDSASVQDLRAKLRALDLAIQNKHREQDEFQKEIRSYQAKIESKPQVEEDYKALTRDSQTAQTTYDTLLAQVGNSQRATDLEKRQQGEQFKVVDDPNLPDGPFYPKRSAFGAGGLAGGLGLGLLIAALLEYKDTALRSERDIWAFTQLPTLAVIAWSGAVADTKAGKPARLKRLFSRKDPKDMLADAPG